MVMYMATCQILDMIHEGGIEQCAIRLHGAWFIRVWLWADTVKYKT